jgi:hypothetical protein
VVRYLHDVSATPIHMPMLQLPTHVAMAMTARPISEERSTSTPNCSRIGMRTVKAIHGQWDSSHGKTVRTLDHDPAALSSEALGLQRVSAGTVVVSQLHDGLRCQTAESFDSNGQSQDVPGRQLPIPLPRGGALRIAC